MVVEVDSERSKGVKLQIQTVSVRGNHRDGHGLTYELSGPGMRLDGRIGQKLKSVYLREAIVKRRLLSGEWITVDPKVWSPNRYAL